jgi:hypothetical protein
MKPLLRGWLPLCLALSFLLAAVRPAPAQKAIGQRPGGNQFGQPGGNNFGQPGGNNFGQPGGNNFGQPNPFGGPAGGNAAAAAAVSSVSTGMIVAGIGLILVGLAVTGGVVYMAMAGQKTSYGGGGRRKKRPRRDDDD